MAEHKVLIVLREGTEIPAEATRMNCIGTEKQFSEPWNNGWQKRVYAEPPMEVHNSFYDGTQIEVRYRDQSLRISVDGDICVDPDCKIDPKKIREMVGMLPSLWKWGQDLRKTQDDIFIRICALLPDWEISFDESERTFFSGKTLEEIAAVLEKFRQAKETVPATQKCAVSEVKRVLEKAWENTETNRKAVEKWREDDKKNTEKAIKERDQKREVKKKEADKILQKAGLI